jgi:hypothetical protein
MTTSKFSIEKTPDDQKKPASPNVLVKSGDTGASELDQEALKKAVGGSSGSLTHRVPSQQKVIIG